MSIDCTCGPIAITFVRAPLSITRENGMKYDGDEGRKDSTILFFCSFTTLHASRIYMFDRLNRRNTLVLQVHTLHLHTKWCTPCTTCPPRAENNLKYATA